MPQTSGPLTQMLMLAVAILAGLNSAPATPAEAAPADLHSIYLPLVVRVLPGLSGYVTLNGVPQAGVVLRLQLDNGHSVVATTSTAPDGTYSFIGVPSLGPGHTYRVQFLNPSAAPDGRLGFWYTDNLTSYTAGSCLTIGNFDLADVPMLAPAAGATVNLPALFTWTPRNGVNYGNSYEWLLQNPPSYSLFAYHELPAQSDAYYLGGLPTGFSLGQKYAWIIIVMGSGGTGGAFKWYDITFASASRASPPSWDLRPHAPHARNN